MKRTVIIGIGVLAALLVLSSGGFQRSAVEANDPGPAPAALLTCADFNGDGPVAGTDFFAILGKFGTTYPNLSFSYLYDTNADGAVSGTDFFATLADFGQTCPLADTQIAKATLWGLGTPTADCAINNPSPPLMENAAALAAIQYTGGGQDVPGQGRHYVKLANWVGGFDPCRPEGLVYNDGRLVAQLYYNSGDNPNVGWGPEPVPVDNVDIDAFCNTGPPYGPCSWSNNTGGLPVDGWHLHEHLCAINLGQPNSQLFRTEDAATCQAAAGGGTWAWFERLGWMGHLWNHALSGNGRLADCAPDPAGYLAFHGTKGIFGPYDCPQ